MRTFKDVIEEVATNLEHMFAAYGFSLTSHSAHEAKGSMAVFGGLFFQEKRSLTNLFNAPRFISLSTAPLRLEMDLLFGRGTEEFSLHELYELEEIGEFSRRQHDLYEAMHDVHQLQSEFERLIQIFLKNGSRFLDNEPTLWLDLKKQRKQKRHTSELERTIKKSAAAFKAQNWHEVISLLETKENLLGEIDQKRLNYARKKLE